MASREKEKYAQASIVPLFDLSDCQPTEPPIRTLRSVRRMCYGDALVCDTVHVVYDVSLSGDVHYACYLRGKLHMAVNADKLNAAQRRVAKWLQARGYEPGNAHTIEGYAYMQDDTPIEGAAMNVVQLELMGVA